MPEYRVCLRATGDVDIEVEASDRDDAIDKAFDIAYKLEPDWEWVDIEELG